MNTSYKDYKQFDKHRELARLYDKDIAQSNVSQSSYEFAILKSKLKELKSPIVVDTGCGTGRFMLACIKANPTAKYIGIDISLVMLLQAIDNFKNSGYSCYFPGWSEKPTFNHLMKELRRNNLALINTFVQDTTLPPNFCDIVFEVNSGGDFIAGLPDYEQRKEHYNTLLLATRAYETAKILKVGGKLVHVCIDNSKGPHENYHKFLARLSLNLFDSEYRDINDAEAFKVWKLLTGRDDKELFLHLACYEKTGYNSYILSKRNMWLQEYLRTVRRINNVKRMQLFVPLHYDSTTQIS
jgi:SAM-dependent methyltransferase